MGKETFPTTTSVAMPVAAPVRHLLNLGLFQPSDWKRLHTPWNKWVPYMMLANT